jgi:hypothetical protein
MSYDYHSVMNEILDALRQQRVEAIVEYATDYGFLPEIIRVDRFIMDDDDWGTDFYQKHTPLSEITIPFSLRTEPSKNEVLQFFVNEQKPSSGDPTLPSIRVGEHICDYSQEIRRIPGVTETSNIRQSIDPQTPEEPSLDTVVGVALAVVAHPTYVAREASAIQLMTVLSGEAYTPEVEAGVRYDMHACDALIRAIERRIDITDARSAEVSLKPESNLPSASRVRAAYIARVSAEVERLRTRPTDSTYILVR